MINYPKIIVEGPRTQRGPAGARRRMNRRVPVQEEEPVEDVIDEPPEDGEIERYLIPRLLNNIPIKLSLLDKNVPASNCSFVLLRNLE